MTLFVIYIKKERKRKRMVHYMVLNLNAITNNPVYFHNKMHLSFWDDSNKPTKTKNSNFLFFESKNSNFLNINKAY